MVLGRRVALTKMTQFDLYDVVRVLRISSGIRPSTLVERPPRIGDTGTVMMVFETPMDGCIVEAGGSKWRTDFRPEDLEKT
jgi:hypothetical protein